MQLEVIHPWFKKGQPFAVSGKLLEQERHLVVAAFVPGDGPPSLLASLHELGAAIPVRSELQQIEKLQELIR